MYILLASDVRPASGCVYFVPAISDPLKTEITSSAAPSGSPSVREASDAIRSLATRVRCGSDGWPTRA